MSDRQVLVRDWLVLLALSGWALALPSYGSEFMVSMALTCLMYIALSSSWGLFCGSTRYLSLATAAFFGIGAYTGAIALDHLPWLQAVALGALVAAANEPITAHCLPSLPHHESCGLRSTGQRAHLRPMQTCAV